MRQDLRYAFRTLTRTPLITLAVIVSLGLGIGANVTVFSWVRAVLLEPFGGVDDQLRLVMVRGRRNREIPTGLSHLDYLDLREAAVSFEGGLVATPSFPGLPVSLGAQREGEFAEQINVGVVSGNAFDALGVRAAVGRTFRPEEDGAPLAHPVVVISYALWVRRFARRPDIIDLPVKLNTRTFTIIGVAPPEFLGTFPAVVQDAWAPVAMQGWLGGGPNFLTSRGSRWITGIGRLKPGVSVEQANAEVRSIAARLEAAYPDVNRARTVEAEPLWRTSFGAAQLLRPVLLVLAALAGVVLLLACANVGNMLLARALGRRREIAVRISIGAARWHLVRQLLVESLILAVLGAGAGLLFSRWAAGVLLTFIPAAGAQLGLSMPFDWKLLSFAVGASMATAALIGVAPALRSTKVDVVSTLKDESSAAGSRRARLHSMLVSSQVAMTLLLLVAAGLFVRSLQRAQTIWPGFNPQQVLLASYDSAHNGYTSETGRQLHQRVVERLETLPGVRSVALATGLPLGPGGMLSSTVRVDGYVPAPNEDMVIPSNAVTPRYFETLEIPLVEGRLFTAADRADTQKVAVINEAMASRYWPGRRALGGVFRTTTAAYEVIGIVRTGKYRELSEAPLPAFYVCYWQSPRPFATIHVRTAGNPSALAQAVAAEFRRIDPALPLTGLMTMVQWME